MQSSVFKKTVLGNGLRVVSEQIPYVRSASIGAWIATGSRHETLQNNGISHYIEHMMFKGTKNRTAAEIAETLESVGGHLNAFTGKELTCYYGHVLDEDLPKAVDVISDFLCNSVFDEREMAKEKKVVLEELNNIEETPEELIHDHFWSDIFPDHSLGYSIIGSRDTINSLSRDDLVKYLGQNYNADRIVLAAAGNVEHEALLELAERCFSGFGKGRSLHLDAPSGVSAGQNVIENGSIQAHVCLGTQAYSYRNRKKFALLVLNTLLGSGMSSRLFQNIREKHGIAYSVYSFIDFMVDSGIFGVYIGTDSINIDGAIGLIREELQKLRQEYVPDDELERTKSQLKGNLMLGLESTSSRMSRLAKMEIFLQDHFSLDDTLVEIENVTKEDILSVADELFDSSRLQTTILKPKSASN